MTVLPSWTNCTSTPPSRTVAGARRTPCRRGRRASSSSSNASAPKNCSPSRPRTCSRCATVPSSSPPTLPYEARQRRGRPATRPPASRHRTPNRSARVLGGDERTRRRGRSAGSPPTLSSGDAVEVAFVDRFLIASSTTSHRRRHRRTRRARAPRSRRIAMTRHRHSASIAAPSALPLATRRSTPRALRATRASPAISRKRAYRRRPCSSHAGSGSTTRSVRAHRARVGHARLEAGRDPREERGAERAAFGDRGTRAPGGRCSRPAPRTQPVDTRAAAGRDDAPRRRSGDASMMRRVTNPDASNAARRTRRGAVREVEVDELGAPVGILQRHPFAARVRHPDRNVVRRPARCRRRRRDASTQFEEQATDVARPADEPACRRRGVRASQ